MDIRFGSVTCVFKNSILEKIGTDRFQEISGTEYFGSRLFRFGSRFSVKFAHPDSGEGGVEPPLQMVFLRACEFLQYRSPFVATC